MMNVNASNFDLGVPFYVVIQFRRDSTLRTTQALAT